MRRAWRRTAPRLRTGGLALVVALAAAGCGAHPGATEQGRLVHGLYDRLFVMAVVVFVLVEGAIVFAVLRWRRRDDQLPPQFHGNNLLEVAWTVVPLLMVAVLFVWTTEVLTKVDAHATEAGDVNLVVTGFQWQWNFTFQGEKVQVEKGQPPEDLRVEGTIAKPPEIDLPVGQRIHVLLQSPDVIHAFFIPEFLFKRDVVPGQRNQFSLTIDRPGSYHGQCAEFCGLAHNGMHFTIRAVSPAEYRAWLAATKRRAESGCPGDDTPGHIAARNIAFDKTCLSTRAGRPWTLAFDNQEAVLHNVAIFRGRDEQAPKVLDGQLITGPKTIDYAVPALPAGKYYYHCDVHPQAMKGTLVVR